MSSSASASSASRSPSPATAPPTEASRRSILGARASLPACPAARCPPAGGRVRLLPSRWFGIAARQEPRPPLSPLPPALPLPGALLHGQPFLQRPPPRRVLD